MSRIACALSMSWLATASAMAAPTYQVAGIVNTHVHSFAPGLQQTDVGYLDFNHLNRPEARGRVQIEAQAQVAGGGTAFGRVSAQPGVLKAWSWSTQPAWTSGRSSFDYAASEIRSSMADTIAVHGAGLADGTPVQYRLSLHIDGRTSQPVFESGGALAAAVSADVRLRDQAGASVGLNWQGDRDANGWYTLLLDTSVGHELLLSASLYATTYVTATARNRLAEVDYGQSSYLYLTPLVSGLNTVGASGYDFSLPTSPVPEPATLWLLASGLAVLSLDRRRGGRRRL